MRRITTTALLGLALAASACEDDSGVQMGPGGDVNGTWIVQGASGVTYLRVLPSTVEMYVETDTCFLKSEFAIQALEGASFTVVPEEGGSPADWTLERVGDRLSVVIDGQALTLDPSTASVGQLQVCGGPDPVFPHPPCSEIPEVEVGGSATGVIEDGDPRWTDDTWYDLWSLQLDAGQTVTMTMTADDPDALDPYLLFYDAAAVTRIDESDDIDFDAGNYDSRIQSIALDAGCYIMVAGSYSGDDDGETGGGYTMAVQAN